jgi:transposase InsO family protein
LIVEIDPSTVNVTEFCRQHGVSTWFFWNLRREYQARGEAALTPRSRAPHTVANKTPTAMEDLIVATRKRLLDAGLDAGAITIADHLRDQADVPSPSTIWRILTARGFVVPEPRKAPRPRGRSFQAERANESWPLDDTNWTLTDGTAVKILNVLDDHSRLAVASRALTTCTGAAALDTVAQAATVVGWPARIFSDNALAFRSVLAEALAPLGIAARHTRPYRPQTNGKVERFHQTQKRWLAAHPAATLPELQQLLDLFRLLYNHDRPHRALDRRTPAAVWHHAPKSGPADQPLGQPTHLHHATVREGRVRLGDRYDITVGIAHEHQPVTAIVTGAHCHIFHAGHLLRTLMLDPTRRRQPLHPHAGRPRLP